jgi:chromatin remodeling complex protein RSC6
MPPVKQNLTKKTAGTSADSQSKRPKAKRAPNQGLMQAVQPSAALAAIVGNTPLPRTEITKRLWGYIKDHQLQDTRDKRLINADEKLRPVVDGKEQVSMFELTKLVSRHVQ